MSSVSRSGFQVEQSLSYLQDVKISSHEVVESALFAIKNWTTPVASSSVFKFLDERHLSSVDFLIQSLVRSVFEPNEILEEVAQTAGYESKEGYVVKELTQTLWNRTEALVDLENIWIAEFVPSSIEIIQHDDWSVCSTFFRSIKKRFDELSVEQVEKYGWITTEKDKIEWPETLIKWKRDSRALKKQIEENQYLLGFSQDEDEREAQYRSFLIHLNRAFTLLSAKNQDNTFFHVELPGLMGVCYTGWKSRVEQITNYSHLDSEAKRADYMTEAHRIARAFRYDILYSRVLPEALTLEGVKEEDLLEEVSNVHNRVLLRQWANKPYHLGISVDPLEEEEAMLVFLEPHLDAISADIMSQYYTADRIGSLLKQFYDRLSSEEKDKLFEPIMDRYRVDLLAEKAPYIDSMNSLCLLYRSLSATKKIYSFKDYLKRIKSLHLQFQSEGFVPPFSALDPKETVEMQLRTSALALPLIRGENLRSSLKRKAVTTFEEERILGLIRDLEHSETKEARDSYMKEQKRRISYLVSNLKVQIALENSRLLRRRIENEKGELEPFGVAFWGVASKVLSPKALIRDKQDVPEKMLDWASCLLLSDGVVERFKEAPDIYSYLSLEVKKSGAVKAVFGEPVDL